MTRTEALDALREHAETDMALDMMLAASCAVCQNTGETADGFCPVAACAAGRELFAAMRLVEDKLGATRVGAP